MESTPAGAQIESDTTPRRPSQEASTRRQSLQGLPRHRQSVISESSRRKSTESNPPSRTQSQSSQRASKTDVQKKTKKTVNLGDDEWESSSSSPEKPFVPRPPSRTEADTRKAGKVFRVVDRADGGQDWTTDKPNRSRGKPRPARIAAVVWKYCGILVDKVVTRLPNPSPERSLWDGRLRRMQQDSVLIKLAKQVLEWERYAAESVHWTDPEYVVKQLEGEEETEETAQDLESEKGMLQSLICVMKEPKKEYIPGRWELPSGKFVYVSDATAAMIQAVGQGGVSQHISYYMQSYMDGLYRRTAIRDYTVAEKAEKNVSRLGLQQEFRQQASTNKRFQAETKVLANELGKRRAEHIQFDTYANAVALKDKSFRVQLRQSQLTAEANLAARSLSTFRQLSKLYGSVKEFMESEPPDFFSNIRGSLMSMKSTTTIASTDTRQSVLQSTPLYGGGSSAQPSGPRVDMSKHTRLNTTTAPKFTDFKDEETPRHRSTQKHIERRNSMQADDPDANPEESSAQRVEDLQSKRDELKMAVIMSGSKSRFEQLMNLMDQGHEKMLQMASTAQHCGEMIQGVSEALEEEVLPQARKWVREMAKQGKLPREMLAKVQAETLNKVGEAEREALIRKVGRLEEILEENKAESKTERALRDELEELGVPVPMAPSQKSEAAKKRIEGRPSFLKSPGPSPKRASTLQPGDKGASDSEVGGRNEKELRRGSSFAKSPSRRKTRARERDVSDMERLMDRIANVVKDSLKLKGELNAAWPKNASEEGDRLIQRVEIFDDAARLMADGVSSLKLDNSLDKLEDKVNVWMPIGQRLVQNMESFIDSLEYETVPVAIVEKGLQNRRDGNSPVREERRGSKGRRGSTAGTSKQEKQIQKLRAALEKVEVQITAQEEQNAQLQASNMDAQRVIIETDREISKLKAKVTKLSNEDQSANDTTNKDMSKDQDENNLESAQEDAKQQDVSTVPNRVDQVIPNDLSSPTSVDIPGSPGSTMVSPTTKAAKFPVQSAASNGSPSTTNKPAPSGSLAEAHNDLLEARAKRKELQTYVNEFEKRISDIESGKVLSSIDAKVDAERRTRCGLAPRKEDDVVIKAAKPVADDDGQGRSGSKETERGRQRRHAIALQPKETREERARKMGLDVGDRDEEDNLQNDDLRTTANGPKKEQSDSLLELEAAEPWRRIFPNDPPDIAKQKYEFCRAHKVVYAHLYIHKKQRRLKFKLLRWVKHQRRELKLKTKLLMSFLTEGEKIAMQSEIGLDPDGLARRAAHHRAELARLNDRHGMLTKLLAFWRRRFTLFDEEIAKKRGFFRGDIFGALDHVARMADVLKAELEEDKLANPPEQVTEALRSPLPVRDMMSKRELVQDAEQQEEIGQPRLSQLKNVRKSGHLVDPHYRPSEGGGLGLKGSPIGSLLKKPNRREETLDANSQLKAEAIPSKPMGNGPRGWQQQTSRKEIMGKNAAVMPRQKSPKKNAAPQVAPEEEKATDFLHILIDRLKAISLTCETNVGEPVLSDTLLAPNVNGKSLLKFYLGQIMDLQEEEREIVLHQLVTLEQQRLLETVKVSANRSVRVALEASNRVIKVLELPIEKMYKYVQSDRLDADDESGSEAADDSSSFASSSDSEATNVAGHKLFYAKTRDLDLNEESVGEGIKERLRLSLSDVSRRASSKGRAPSKEAADKSRAASKEATDRRDSARRTSLKKITLKDIFKGNTARRGSNQPSLPRRSLTWTGTIAVSGSVKENEEAESKRNDTESQKENGSDLRKLKKAKTVKFKMAQDESSRRLSAEKPRRLSRSLSAPLQPRRLSTDGQLLVAARRKTAEAANSQMKLLELRGLARGDRGSVLEDAGSTTFCMELQALQNDLLKPQSPKKKRSKSKESTSEGGDTEGLQRKKERKGTLGTVDETEEGATIEEKVRTVVKRRSEANTAFTSTNDDSDSDDESDVGSIASLKVGERASMSALLGNHLGRIDNQAADKIRESKSPSIVSTMMVAKFAKNLMDRRKSMAGAGERYRDKLLREKFIETCTKFVKHMKRKGVLDEVEAAANSSKTFRGVGRPKSAYAKLVSLNFGRRGRIHKEFALAAFTGRENFRRRASVLPEYTKELNREWMAIKDAVRQTKHMRLNAQQQRVAEMLLEMSSKRQGDLIDEVSPQATQRQDLFRQVLSKKAAEVDERGKEVEQVRKAISQSMRRTLERRARADSLADSPRRSTRRSRKSSRKVSNAVQLSRTKTGHLAENWKLDQELFAMMEEGVRNESESEDKVEVRPATHRRRNMEKASVAKICAKNRRLRQRAMLGLGGNGGAQKMSHATQERLGHGQDGPRVPKWNRWARKQPGIGRVARELIQDSRDIFAGADTVETQRSGKRRQAKKKLKLGAVSASPSSPSRSRRASEAVQLDLECRSRRQSMAVLDVDDDLEKILAKCPSPPVESSESGLSDSSSGEKGDVADGEEGGEESSHSGSEIFNPAEDSDLSDIEPDDAPRRKHRPGYLLPLRAADLIRKAEHILRPALASNGRFLEVQLGVPLAVIFQTALGQDPECQAILLSMSEDDFLTAMEGMTIELENRYLSMLDPEQLKYITPGQPRRQQSKGRTSKPEVVCRSAPPKSRIHGGIPQRQVITQRSQVMNRSMGKHPNPHMQAVGQSYSKHNLLKARKVGRQAQQARILKTQKLFAEATKATEYRHMDFRHMDASIENRGKVAAEVMSWIIQDTTDAANFIKATSKANQRTPASLGRTDKESRGRSTLNQLEDLRGALHEQIENAFHRHVTVWKQWRNEGIIPENRRRSPSAHSEESEEWNIGVEDICKTEAMEATIDFAPCNEGRSLDDALEKNASNEVVTKNDIEEPLQGLSDDVIHSPIQCETSQDTPTDASFDDQMPAPEPILQSASMDLGLEEAETRLLEAAASNREGQSGTLRLPAMVVRPIVSNLSEAPFDIVSSKRTGQLPALESQLLPSCPSDNDIDIKTPRESQGKDMPQSPFRQKGPLAKVLPSKRPPSIATKRRSLNMDQYLENFDIYDLEEMLHDFSRPGTRLSRPSTRNSRPGTRNTFRHETPIQGDTEQDPKAHGWPDDKMPDKFGWSFLGNDPGSAHSTRSPRTLYSATTSSGVTSTSEEWKRALVSRDGSQWRQWPQVPSTAPDTGSGRGKVRQIGGLLDTGRFPKLPETGEDLRRVNTAIGSSRQLANIGFEGSRGFEGSKGLANLCSDLEQRAAADAYTDSHFLTPREGNTKREDAFPKVNSARLSTRSSGRSSGSSRGAPVSLGKLPFQVQSPRRAAAP